MPVPVVFLAGMGRSGSTLLDRALATSQSWWSLGEVVHLWQRGLVDDERCGCGARFSECEVWHRIGDEAFGGWSQLDVDAVLALQASVERDRWIPLLLRPSLSSDFAERLASYQGILARLYHGAAAATGARVVVDASKHVSAALGLRRNDSIELHLVHLIRDSRGVALSWTKSVQRPATDGRSMMAQWSPLETSLRYLAYNTGLAVVFGRRRHVLRYEDFVTNPHRELAAIRRLVGGETDAGVEDSHDASLDLGVSHGLSGNPMRARTGRVDLRLDDAWREELSTRDRCLVTAITAPALLSSGYRLGHERMGDRPRG